MKANTIATGGCERGDAEVAWLRMMGADSVDYHAQTIVNRADDHPGQALAYYASRGGRRGRAATASPTEGLIYATTRHATSRAGDPSPHDHVLLANVVSMADDTGGYKAADTALWREHVHAATMAGRIAGARAAVD